MNNESRWGATSEWQTSQCWSASTWLPCPPDWIPFPSSLSLRWVVLVIFLRLIFVIDHLHFYTFSPASVTLQSCDNLSAYSAPLGCYLWSRWEHIVFCRFAYIFTATRGCFLLCIRALCFQPMFTMLYTYCIVSHVMWPNEGKHELLRFSLCQSKCQLVWWHWHWVGDSI